MPDTEETLSGVLAALRPLRVPATPGEYDLHRMIGEALARAGIACEHEVPLAPRCRIDFLAGDVGIEVKRGAAPARALRAQAEKYLKSDRLRALVLVATRGVRMPGRVAGKRVVVFGLNRLWGVALP
ncbi:MAG: hypothetical protein VB065_12995 [Eubacteriales bacterium]|nr:hypothetical protein [Christensenellaceae bacterium]MEA5066953.1 hypothetical protein [Eubacteriales bacterium]